jgi:hypothetical protein
MAVAIIGGLSSPVSLWKCMGHSSCLRARRVKAEMLPRLACGPEIPEPRHLRK